MSTTTEQKLKALEIQLSKVAKTSVELSWRGGFKFTACYTGNDKKIEQRLVKFLSVGLLPDYETIYDEELGESFFYFEVSENKK